ncbi:MAG: Hsp20/alpha crystallin family protein [candidate division WOR-3 bacterium]|nr:Hsp20/alpha crystallin family protein [candidate division WOR-3 bacterium]MDW8150294.1 Hsp20/alpha crystallin family protein [candidate division WOR-3 bacterium]
MKKYPVRRSIIEELFEKPLSILSEFERRLSEVEEGKVKVWSPYIDMVEYDDRYEVVVELPGIEKENIKVNIKNNLLIVSGEKKEHYEKKDNMTFHYQSISYGKFQAEVGIPSDVEIEKISASYKNGVLKLTLPKSIREEKKEIKIEFE